MVVRCSSPASLPASPSPTTSSILSSHIALTVCILIVSSMLLLWLLLLNLLPPTQTAVVVVVQCGLRDRQETEGSNDCTQITFDQIEFVFQFKFSFQLKTVASSSPELQGVRFLVILVYLFMHCYLCEAFCKRVAVISVI